MATGDRTSAYVWVWLPDATEPAVAGRLDGTAESGLITFTYGRSYLRRGDATALFLPDLPLESAVHYPVSGQVPGPIADASPDAWGRRVIENRNAAKGRTSDVGPVEVLLESGSNRVGALDFQASHETYVPRLGGTTTLDELVGGDGDHPPGRGWATSYHPIPRAVSARPKATTVPRA
ncbi:MAG: HipA N-terminal domain-containing protein [Acidimicrobiales bacterium]